MTNQSHQGQPPMTNWSELGLANNGTLAEDDARMSTVAAIMPHIRGTGSYRASNSTDSFELVMITLTLPLWTFITLYVLLMLIHHLRQLQYFNLYDKCTSRNAHFRYDFHIVCGRHSHNYNTNESVILDLLDNHTVPTMSIQVPGPTVFNDHQIFMYRHSRANLRCIQFTVYRRHPIKDVKSIRIAHSCANPDSRLYIYGVDLHDETNSESRFFPITTVVKYRGTQWALATTFEPKADVNFKKMGVDCHDPFGTTSWPTYSELVTILLYIWCSSFCFGHLIKVKDIADSVPLHALTIVFIVATSAAVLSAIYLRVIKVHIVNGHYDTNWWYFIQRIYFLMVIIVSLTFWSLALRQSNESRRKSLEWLLSTGASSIILTLILVLTWLLCSCRRCSNDLLAENETNAILLKTNSKEGIQFVNDPVQGLCASLRTTQESSSSRRDHLRSAATKTTAAKNVMKSIDRKATKTTSAGGKQNKRTDEQAGVKKTEDNETLDTAFGHGSKHMRVKNRNSISQYV